MSLQKNKWYQLFCDILKENDKFSQGRVYLFVAVLFYFVIHAVMTWKAYYTDNTTVTIENLELISEGLYKAMILFGGYVFGGKFLKVVEVLKRGRSSKVGTVSDKK